MPVPDRPRKNRSCAVQKWWSLLFGVVLLAELLLFAIAPMLGWWLPHLANRESLGWDIDKLFYLILILTGFFFVLTEVILVVAMWRFAGEPGRRSVYVHGNHTLEMAWTLVPAAILLFIAFVQISAWADIKYAKQMRPPHHLIEVSARQFEWRMRYPSEETRAGMTAKWNAGENPYGKEEWVSKDAEKAADKWGHDNTGNITDFHTVNEVHTWAGANTRIYLKTRDVLHSFFLPELRLKQDAVPGKVIPVWFKATDWNTEFKDGELVVNPDKRWELACAELCGWGHYKMSGKLYVHKDKESYDAWLRHRLAQQNARTRTSTR